MKPDIFNKDVRPARLPDEGPRPYGHEDLDPAQEQVRKVGRHYQAAKAHRKHSDKNWDRFYRLYLGQHWDTVRPDWKAAPVLNFIFATIETIIPIMTDSRPHLIVAPMGPGDEKLAEIHGHLQKKLWLDNDMDLKLPQLVKLSLIYGSGFIKVWWDPWRGPIDPDTGLPMGDVAYGVVDPRHVFPSPGATSLDDAEYFVFAANIPLSRFRRDFPECAEKVRPGVWDGDLTLKTFVPGQNDSNSAKVVSPVFRKDLAPIGSIGNYEAPSLTDDQDDVVTLIEHWDRNEDGRLHVTVVANGVLVRERQPTPYKHNLLPFVKLDDYVLPGYFWGMGEIHQLEKVQDGINRRRGQTHDLIRITANPPIIADANSGIDPRLVTTRPGIIIKKNPGTHIGWLPPPTLPAALFMLQDRDKMDFDAISGIFDVTQGRRPVGIEAAAAISELQEAAQTRIRLKVRNLEAAIRRLGKLSIALVQQYYTQERSLRLVTEGSGAQVVKLNQKVSLDNSEKNVTILNDVTIGEYDLEVGVGSTLPVNKSRRFEQLLQLFQVGAADRQALLEYSGLPLEEVRRILERLKQQEEKMMAAQAAAEEGTSPEEQEEASPPSSEELDEALQG